MNTLVTNSGEVFTSLQPLNDRVLVKRIGPPVDRDGSSWIPDIAHENTKYAQVIAAGPKAFGVYAGDEVILPGIANKYPDWETSDFMMVQVADIGLISNRG
jgi:co-chaperonin GroES (HSP10)